MSALFISEGDEDDNDEDEDEAGPPGEYEEEDDEDDGGSDLGEGEEEEEVGLSYLMKEEIQVKWSSGEVSILSQMQAVRRNCLQTSVLI